MGKTSRVVVYGMKGVGKTAILEQSIYGNITKDTVVEPTIEDIYAASIETERGTKERVRFYDTGGSERAAPVQPSDGYLLVFDPASMESLDFIIDVKKDIDRVKEKKEVVVIVVCNSRGGERKSVVTSKAGGWTTRERLRLFEATALDRSSLHEPLVHLASRLNPQPNKSAFPQLRKRD